MENSKAYKYLIEQINATEIKKMDGYYPRIMDEIYDRERDDVENIIWNTFNNNKDYELAKFLPKLKKYNGIEALKGTLIQCNIPSDNSVTIAKVLYEYTGDNKYLEVIKSNIEKDKDNISNVAMLLDCKPSEGLYNLLVNIYIDSDNKIVRSSAAIGILYNKGLIRNPHDMQEIMNKIELRRKFARSDRKERIDVIKQLENGQLEKLKSCWLQPSSSGYPLFAALFCSGGKWSGICYL